MRPIAFLQPDRPDLDTIIVWDDSERLVAFGYREGQVVSSRPLEATALGEEANEEIEQAFGVPATAVATVPFQDKPARWT